MEAVGEGATGTSQVQRRDAAKCPTGPGTAPTTKNEPIQNVKDAEAEKPWCRQHGGQGRRAWSLEKEAKLGLD